MIHIQHSASHGSVLHLCRQGWPGDNPPKSTVDKGIDFCNEKNLSPGFYTTLSDMMSEFKDPL